MTDYEVDFVGGRLVGAVVPKSSLGGEAWDVPQAIVEFTNDARAVAQYTDQELSPEVLGIYFADYYLAQVNNGGHSQFVGNSGAHVAANINHSLLGLKLIGAEDQFHVLADLKAWVASNSDEAATQDGFSHRATQLDALDTRFYDAEKRASITDLAANWIRAWQKLEIVDDERYKERLRALGARNPNFEIRRIWQSSEHNRFNLTDTLQMTIAVLCGAVMPQPEIKFGITAGIPYNFEGQSVIAWGVKTDKAVRNAIVLDSGGILHETLGGRQIARVSAQTVKTFIDAAERNNAAVAIDLAMQRAGFLTSDVGYPAITAWKLEGDRTTFIARVFGAHSNANDLVIRTDTKGASLLDDVGTPTLLVPTNEIAAYADQARRGRESLKIGNRRDRA